MTLPPEPKKAGAPGSVVPQHVMAFADADRYAVAIGADTPMPIRAITLPAVAAPFIGSSAVSTTVGPFTPDLGRPIRLTLSGSWSGGVQVLRSCDGGVTRLPITAGGQPWGSFTANANEAVAVESEAGATYWIAIQIASGAVTYRLAQ